MEAIKGGSLNDMIFAGLHLGYYLILLRALVYQFDQHRMLRGLPPNDFNYYVISWGIFAWLLLTIDSDFAPEYLRGWELVVLLLDFIALLWLSFFSFWYRDLLAKIKNQRDQRRG